ncbi:PAS domain-containing protein [Streptomyces sp. NPDC006552]|uniref:PAS domain-containing protein n=1 Tax=Streptomyces sp. NPDC006552 TaxID=3157179 RepID=UPI0033AD0737
MNSASVHQGWDAKGGDEARPCLSLNGGLPSAAAVAAVVVLDKELTVRNWNAGAGELWGPRQDEVLGRPFFGLEFGLPTGELRPAVEECVATGRGGDPVVIAAVDRHGRDINCSVLCSPFDGHPGGVVLLMAQTRSAPTP